MGLRRCSIVRVGLVAAAIAGAAQAAPARGAETRVTRDATPGSYVRYDGGDRRDDAVAAAPVGEARTSRAWRWTRATPWSSSPARMTTARRSQNGSGNVWAGLLPLDRRRRDVANSLVPGYPADASPPAPLADQGQLRGGRRPDAGVRRRRPPVLRLHLLQPRQAHERLALRRHATTRTAPSYVRTVRVDRGTPSVRGLFQDKINVTADQALGQRLRAVGAVSGPGGQQHAASSRARPITARRSPSRSGSRRACPRSSSPTRPSGRTGLCM